MGGYGSGPIARYLGTVDESLSLDIARLHKAGALCPGSSGTWTWRFGYADSASINWMTSESSVTLRYGIKRTGEQLAYDVDLDRTPCNFGGSRAWFLCVGCDRRCRVLSLSRTYFICRECAGLTYTSRRASRNLSALATHHGVGLFQDRQILRRLRYRLARTRNPHKALALRRRIARLEMFTRADVAVLERLLCRASPKR